MKRYLVGIPCLFGVGHTKEAIDSVVDQENVDVLLIDNGAELPIKHLINSYSLRKNVFIIRNDVNIYVNPAWNQIIKFFLDHPRYDQLCIMNSDLIMHYQWSAALDVVLNLNPDLIPIPVITDSKFTLGHNIDFNHYDAQNVYTGTPGVFICINRKQAEIVYPIPSEIKVWFGDNFILDTLRQLNYTTTIPNILISYHYWSQNVQKVENISAIIEEDKLQWENKVIHDMKILINKHKK